MTEERKHEIESIINNALTDEDCKEWAAGNMTGNVAALVKKYNIKQLNIWDDVCEIVDFYPESIKREATWDYALPPDDKGWIGTETVKTIETWEWSDELNRYELVYLEEKETGDYIPYNEHVYINNGVTIPIPKETKKEKRVVAYKIRFSRDVNYKEGMYLLETDDELLYTHNPTDLEAGEPYTGSWTDSEKEWSCDKNIKILAEPYWYPKKLTGELMDGLHYDENGNESGICDIPTLAETRKEQVERETREFLIRVLVETYDIKPEKAPDYISEFLWVKTCLYASIDKLRNPTIVATMKCGVIF